ncbi:lipid-A-disaccharide synthase [Natronospora cellulosivora (SeqCode)]
MTKIMVAAGEVSGDMHAARVIKEINKIKSDLDFYGMGSDFLQEAGVRILLDPMDISSIGFFEPLKNIQNHLKNLKKMKKSLDKEKPDIVFLVDNSGFNMLLAKAAYKRKIPVINYFSPSAWIWGKWRAKRMAKYRATIASVFPMEEKVYREAGANVVFVGHPLLDIVDIQESKEDIYKDLELDPLRTVIALMPGSRNQEIESLLPIMLETAERIQGERKECQFVLPLARGISKERVAKMAAKHRLYIKLVTDKTYQLMKVADLAITASGTATLEAAIIGTPMITVYRINPATYFLAKRLVKLQYISLPNIIADRKIVPELIQDSVNTDQIYANAMSLLNKPYKLKHIRDELKYVKEKLGSGGAVKRTAELILAKAINN